MADTTISPAESFLSTPSDNYPSLFSASTPSSSTMNPAEIMTPQSYSNDDGLPSSPVYDVKMEDDQTPAPTAETDKRSTKKRKSWGQVLPEPKTNLPPRKRAKTDDEKEQRRVERVLRNRRAAQSSRERKRLEVEALEERNKSLEQMLLNAEKANKLLMEEITQIRQSHGISTFSSNVALSQELFAANEEAQSTLAPEDTDNLCLSSSHGPSTVDPATLSPHTLSPVPEDQAAEAEISESKEDISTSNEPTTDVAQHPAVMLSDLQCPSEVDSMPVRASPLRPQTSKHQTQAWPLFLAMMLLSASTTFLVCQRPLTQIALSLKAGFSLRPSPQLLATIIWVVTLPQALRNTLSTSTNSFSQKRQTTSPQASSQQQMTHPQRTTNSTRGSSTLRLKFLRKLLSSSPMLARPLMDATVVALRLASSKGLDDRAETLRGVSSATRECDSELTNCLKRITLPSQEVLMTLLWALKLEQKRTQRKNSSKYYNRLLPDASALDKQQQPNATTRLLSDTEGEEMRGVGSTNSPLAPL